MTIFKETLLDNLAAHTFCRLALSDIDGIGVLAIKDIPEGTHVFQTCNRHDDAIVELRDKDLESLDHSVVDYIKDIFVKEESGAWPIPEEGLNSINISFYLNHSDNNNLSPMQSGTGYVHWVSNRLIKSGEELTNDYRTLGSSKELSKQFPWLFTHPFII